MRSPLTPRPNLLDRVRSKARDPLWSNVTALGVLQAVSLFIPLATLPYLVRVLGPVGYGEMALCLAIIAYVTLLADFGLGMSAVRAIAAKRDDEIAMSRACGSTLAVRLGLGLAAWLALAIGMRLVPTQSGFSRLVLSAAPMIPAAMLNMSWYFQGIQRLRAVVAAQVVVRLSGLALLFVFVRQSTDLPRAIDVELFMALAASAATWLLMWPHRGVLRQRPATAELRQTLAEAAPVFAATLGSALYTNALTIVLGAVSTRTEIGYFAVADRITFAAERLLHPLQQALFPHVNALRERADIDALCLLRTLLRRTILLGTPATAVFAVLAPWLIDLVAGKATSPAIVPLLIMAPQPLLIALSNLIGIQALLTFGHARAVALVQWAVGISALAMAWPASRCMGAVGASLVSTTAELAVLLCFAAIAARRLRFS